MVRFTADDRAERDQRVELRALSELLKRQRDFQRARHGDEQHVFAGHAEAFEFFDARVGEAVADGFVKTRLNDADAQSVAVEVRLVLSDFHVNSVVFLGEREARE
jgi:hypothetical protein